MAKGSIGGKQQQKVKHKPKRSATSGNSSMVRFSGLSKSQKRNYKEYRGQGR